MQGQKFAALPLNSSISHSGLCNCWSATSFTVGTLLSIICTSPSKPVANSSAIKRILDRLTSPTFLPHHRHIGPSLKSLWLMAAQSQRTSTVLVDTGRPFSLFWYHGSSPIAVNARPSSRRDMAYLMGRFHIDFKLPSNASSPIISLVS